MRKEVNEKRTNDAGNIRNLKKKISVSYNWYLQREARRYIYKIRIGTNRKQEIAPRNSNIFTDVNIHLQQKSQKIKLKLPLNVE